MRYIQHNCIEGEGIDLRQANAVLRHEPDIILFEAPRHTRSFGWPCNDQSLVERLDFVEKHKKMLHEVARRYPWVWSDAFLLDNVVRLWKTGHHIDLYDVDAPSELLQETIQNGWNLTKEPRQRGVHFPWWVYIYLRERMMANAIAEITSRSKNQDLTALVAMQKFHWLHVRFLLSCPAKSEIFTYYFGAFSHVSMHNIGTMVGAIGNPVLPKYWKRVSDFTIK